MKNIVKKKNNYVYYCGQKSLYHIVKNVVDDKILEYSRILE